MASAADSADDRGETVGRPLPDTEVRIADLRTGETAACGAVGEICTRGYLVMRGYLDAPEATAAAIDADGWLHTGDLGSMDERGYLRIAGRIQDMIIRGGENIPAAPDAAVDDLADELAEFCRDRLAAYKVPIRWLITDAFPLTASGKVRKDALREQLADGSPA
jgi:fatty-acyl-CoA synthase